MCRWYYSKFTFFKLAYYKRHIHLSYAWKISSKGKDSWSIQSHRTVITHSDELVIHWDDMSLPQTHHGTGHRYFFGHSKAPYTFQLWLSLVFVRIKLWKPAAGAENWLESGTVTWWWLIETHARRGGRGSGGQDQILSLPLYLAQSLSWLCQKAHRLRKTALIKTFV